MDTQFGAVEGGGTKFVCAIGSKPGDIRNHVRIVTTTPNETLGKVAQYFQNIRLQTEIKSIGIGCFGPIDPNKGSSGYGRITTTPKPGWGGADVVGALSPIGLPIAFDTDVNAAVLAEHRWGAGKDLTDVIYVTIGTGIGGGAVVKGELLHGTSHPEMGHVFVGREAGDESFNGVCPYHSDCLESRASGPSIQSRWGKPPEDLPDDHPAWSMESRYIARGLANLTLTLSPQRIILGGGVTIRSHIFPMIRNQLIKELSGFKQDGLLANNIDEYVVPPSLGTASGILGGIALARNEVAND